MARLSLVNGKIILYPDKETMLLEGALKSNLIFDRGFEFDPEENKFVLGTGRDVELEIANVVGLLRARKLTLVLDQGTQAIYGERKAKLNEFISKQDRGNQIKKKKEKSESQPSQFTKPLLDSQRRAVALHSEMPFSADFSVPGSGKTWIGYATYEILKKKGIVDRLLVIGPISSFKPWQEEYQIIFGKKPPCALIKDNRTEREKIYKNSNQYEIFLISYYTVVNDEEDMEELLSKGKFMTILDESHNIKQIEAKRTQAILRLAEYSQHRMILSGTPIPRSIEDLYTQFAFLDTTGRTIGSFQEFGDITDDEDAIALLKQRISPFYYRIKKSDIQPKLPNTVFIRELINLESGKVTNQKGISIDRIDSCPIQSSIYYAIEGKYYQFYQKEKEMTLKWSEALELQKWQKNRLMRLMQVASNPALLMDVDLELGSEKINPEGLSMFSKIRDYSKLNEHPAKLQRAEKITRTELDNSRKRKIIIWTSFVQNIKELRKRLKDFDPAFVYGEIPKDEKENQYLNRLQQVDKFKNDKKCRVLIGNPASLAESVSLHKNAKGEPVCDTAIYVDRTFNGAHYMQSLDRIHRIGLSSNKVVRYFILEAADSVDLDIDDSLERKITSMYRFLNDDIRKFNLETGYGDLTGGLGDQDDYLRVMSRIVEHAEKGKFDKGS